MELNSGNKINTEAVRFWIVLEALKELYIELMETIDVGHKMIPLDPNEEYIELYHATTSAKLKHILSEGLKPNTDGHNRWNNEITPMRNVVYLTDRWQYYFAAVIYCQEQEKRLGKTQWELKLNAIEQHLSKEQPFHHIERDFPVYVKVRINKSRLIADEDFFFTKAMNDRLEQALIKQGVTIPDFNPKSYEELMAFMSSISIDHTLFEDLGFYDKQKLAEECLSFNGTVAALGGILPEDIVEIRCLPSLEVINQTLLHRGSLFSLGYHSWQSGVGTTYTKEDAETLGEYLLSPMDISITEWIHEIEDLVANYADETVEITYKQ